MPGLPNKYWCVNPGTSSTSGLVTLNDMMWQPFWTGECVRMAQIQLALPSLADTAGNVVSFALYADRGDLWPGALVAVLGDLTTTTSSANTSKTLAINQPVTPRSVYWLASVAKGGNAPSLRLCTGAHPLLGAPDTPAVRTAGTNYPYNAFHWTGATFPSVAGDETVLTPVSSAPRLNWSGS